jgi:hypothetical protein
MRAAISTATDPVEVLARDIHITRQFAERFGDTIVALHSAASVAPEMAVVYATGMERHKEGAERVIERLSQLGGLRPGLSRDAAAAILATLTAHTIYASLTREFHWGFDACEAWLNGVLRQQLLPNPDD